MRSRGVEPSVIGDWEVISISVCITRAKYVSGANDELKKNSFAELLIKNKFKKMAPQRAWPAPERGTRDLHTNKVNMKIPPPRRSNFGNAVRQLASFLCCELMYLRAPPTPFKEPHSVLSHQPPPPETTVSQITRSFLCTSERPGCYRVRGSPLQWEADKQRTRSDCTAERRWLTTWEIQPRRMLMADWNLTGLMLSGELKYSQVILWIFAEQIVFTQVHFESVSIRLFSFAFLN